MARNGDPLGVGRWIRGLNASLGGKPLWRTLLAAAILIGCGWLLSRLH